MEEMNITKEITFTEMIEQLRDSIKLGIENVNKEIKQNELILELLEKGKHEELEEYRENIKNHLDKLNESLEKMKEHSNLSLEILEESKDEKVAKTVAKLLRILIRK